MFALALVYVLTLGQVTSDLPATKPTPQVQKTTTPAPSNDKNRALLKQALERGNKASGMKTKYVLWNSTPTTDRDTCFVILEKENDVVGVLFFFKDNQWQLMQVDFVEESK